MKKISYIALILLTFGFYLFTFGKNSERSTVDSLSNMGFKHILYDNLDSAVICFEQALQIDPENFKDYNMLGIAYNDGQQYDKAINILKIGISKYPNSTGLYNTISKAYLALNKHDEAMVSLLKAVENNNFNPDAYFNLGNFYLSEKDYESALASFIQALSFNHDHDSPYLIGYVYYDTMYNIGFIYNHLGEHLNAIDVLNELIEKVPEYTNAYYVLGLAYKELGQTNKAKSFFVKAAQLGSVDAQDYCKRHNIKW